MGADMIGPYIEQQGQDDRWYFVAQLSWSRDYLLFDALDGGRHGIQDYTVVKERQEPENLSHELTRSRALPKSMWEFERNLCLKVGIDPTLKEEQIKEELKKLYDQINEQWNEQTTYPEGTLNNMTELSMFLEGSKTYYSYVTLDQLIDVQHVYIYETEKYFEEHPEYKEPYTGEGMRVIPYMAGNSSRHSGVDMAITIMQKVGNPTRLVYSYTY
jgi:hypothetical protein